ncbi:formate dehydrogenase subunit delta [Coralloluteibacterium thermophilus]|uniref:Formate dehydrogenase subunit delta n=1 Tax=Coralloluteibacterium thermophilum TaxID=2707049 RepID=A0ABV9NL76_9GAMM
MNPTRLAEMANDIGRYFDADPDEEAAIEGMVLHLQRFWEPRMRAQIVAYLGAGGDALDPFPRRAIARLAPRRDDAPPPPFPEGGGDAG